MGKTLVAVAIPVAVEVPNEESNTRSTDSPTAKRAILPPKQAERDSTLLAIHTLPGTMSGHTTTVVSLHPSWPTTSTSNRTGTKATKSTNALHPHRMLQQKFAT